MAPNIRLKGPKSSGNKVAFSTECHIYNGQQIQKFNLLIRLPSQVLGSLAYPFTNQIETSGTKKQPKNNTNESIKHEDGDSNSDSDLSSLDWELNKALSSSNTIPSSEITFKAASTSQGTQDIAKNDSKEADDRSAGYRTIPKNLISIIKKELGDLGDTDDDLGMIEKMVFTLKDPLSASKIGLPVKSNLCQHFECFDFENFCIFNKIPMGVKNLIKKDLAKRNLDLKKSEKLSKLNQPGHVKYDGHATNTNASFIHFPSFSPSIKGYKHPFAQPRVPAYKCPVCNVSFALNQLYISDVFNFFVKTTPKHIDRIELMDMVKYKIIDDSKANWANTKSHVSHEPEELVILSDDDDVDDVDSTAAQHAIHNNEHTQVDPQIPESTDDVFNDGLDNELLRLSNLHEHATDGYKGRGSWEDPVTLD